MRIFRFDEELSIPVREFGSRFRLAPLMGLGADVAVHVAYVPAGGAIGRHPAACPQMFAVVAGSGWVSGPDGERTGVSPGYAAWWDTGEAHEVGSEEGLTAVCIEGTFKTRAFAVTQQIVVVDYDPEWPRTFDRIRQHVWPALGDVAVRVDHIGSTSVVGLAAKPIIDLDVVVADEDEVEEAIARLATVGYRWRGDLGVIGRQAFDAPSESTLGRHHLYVVVENNRAHLDHVLLRDLLRADADARQRYAALKRRNVESSNGNIDVYVAAKAALVAELLTRARQERGLPPETYWDPFAPGAPAS
jgi:GrpB-like predicted nucleotidyltransferase (UPF0157 family)